MQSENQNIIIDANHGPVDLFLNITIGSNVLIENGGGHFDSHHDRKRINGIEPFSRYMDDKNRFMHVQGMTMKVLSFEKLLPGGETEEKEVIVLTDGKYSYWFAYYNERYKSWIKLVK